MGFAPRSLKPQTLGFFVGAATAAIGGVGLLLGKPLVALAALVPAVMIWQGSKSLVVGVPLLCAVSAWERLDLEMFGFLHNVSIAAVSLVILVPSLAWATIASGPPRASRLGIYAVAFMTAVGVSMMVNAPAGDMMHMTAGAAVWGLHFLAFFIGWAALNCATDRQRWLTWLIGAGAFAGLVSNTWVFLLWLGTGWTIGKTSEMAAMPSFGTIVGNIGVTMSLAGVAIALTGRRWSVRILGLLFAVVMILTIVLPFSRACFVAAIVGLITMLWLRNWRWGLFASIVLAALYFYVPVVHGLVLDLFTQRFITYTWSRVALWVDGVRIAMSHPLWGVGPTNFARFQQAGLGSSITPHNTYIGIAAEAGLPALLFFLRFVFGWLVGSLRVYRESSEWLERSLALTLFGLTLAIGVESMATEAILPAYANIGFASMRSGVYLWLLAGVVTAMRETMTARRLHNDCARGDTDNSASVCGDATERRAGSPNKGAAVLRSARS